MKVMWIVCNESLSNEVREILDIIESVEGYTVWEGLYGADKKSGKPRWGDAIWPGLNWAFWIVAEDEALAPVTISLRKLKETEVAKFAGLRAWTQDIDPLL